MVSEAAIPKGRVIEMRIISILILSIAFTGLIEWITGIRIGAGFLVLNLPMPPDVALFFTVFSLIIYRMAAGENYKISLTIRLVFTFIALYGLFKFFNFILNLDYYLIKPSLHEDGFPIWKMSPISGLLFFISGTVIVFSDKLSQTLKLRRIIFATGVLTGFTGFTALLGHLYQTPLLYGKDIMPIAFATAICFILLGILFLHIAGNILFSGQFSGGKAAASLVRAILPVIVIAITLQGLLVNQASSLQINQALYLALLCLAIVALVSAYIFYISGIVFKRAILAESELIKENDFNNLLLDNLAEGVAACDSEGRITRMNKTLMHWLRNDCRNKTFEEVNKICELYYKDCKTRIGLEELPLVKAFRGETIYNEEVVIKVNQDKNRHFLVNAVPFFDASQKKQGALITLHDITTKIEHEQERATTLKLLQLLNERNNLHELIEEITSFLHQWSQCEAVGIRLKIDEDYPYFESIGFPKEFIEKEKWLCERDFNGKILKDACGNPVLECMCGNVIKGKFDPSKPFFTSHGSFYTNSTTKLLKGTSDKDRLARTRNRCHGEGYESVALIPLRSGSETLGLIQLNDSKPDMFTTEIISQLEQYSDSIALALHQRRTEAALKESEEKYRSLAESNDDYIMRYDRHGKHLYLNEAALKVSGLRADQIIGKSHLEAGFDPEQSRFWEEKIAFVFQTGEPHNSQFKWESTNGPVFLDWKLIPEYDLSGNIKTVLGVSRDITKLKKHEEQLRILSRAVDQNPASIIITTTDGNIEYVNPKFTALTGYSPDEAKGRNPRFLKSGETPVETYPELYKSLALYGEWQGEFINRKKNGDIYYESAFISSIRDENNTVTHYLAIKVDITEKKKLLNELMSAKTKAEESEKLKTAFLANMSHEIRTPMNAILGFSELLAKTTVSEETIRKYSEIINSRSGYLLTLIDDILDLSKVEAGLVRLKVMPFQLNELLDEICEQLNQKIKAQKKEIKVIVNKERSDENSLVLSDKYRIQQLLTNLCDNAIKFTQKGTVTIQYRSHKEKGIIFTVSDTGIGIPQTNHELIFERFHKSNDINLNYSGLGLGLSICKGILRILGGEIWVESELNQGSSFSFNIPVQFVLDEAYPELSTEAAE